MGSGALRGRGWEAEPTRKLRVGVIFGGRSSEHEVSLRSAAAVLAALDRERFEPVPLAITRQGRWLLPTDSLRALASGPDAVSGAPLAVLPGHEPGLVAWDGEGGVGAGGGTGSRAPTSPARAEPAHPARAARSVDGSAAALLPALDVIFPVLHGPNGEDGTIQGLLETCGLPYVGAGVLGSALGMDKVIQKDVLVRHAVPVADYLLVRRDEWQREREAVHRRVIEAVGLPCFVKPARLGSSVGVTKVHAAEELEAALRRAAAYGPRVVCERALDAREIECAVLGNDDPRASLPGEVVPGGEFYDYEAKYTEGGSRLLVPADLPPDVTDQVRGLAVRVFRLLDVCGMARVDFFLERGTGRLLVNELNTIPGFTSTSMYPRLWEASGLPYRDLLTRLIELALERHRQRAADAEA